MVSLHFNNNHQLDCFAPARNDETRILTMREPAVYIMTNKRNGTLYVGVTSDIGRRAYEHRAGLTEGFTKRYGCTRLVWYEFYELMTDAIEREKKIKGASRNYKLRLIEDLNPAWDDLFETL